MPSEPQRPDPYTARIGDVWDRRTIGNGWEDSVNKLKRRGLTVTQSQGALYFVSPAAKEER